MRNPNSSVLERIKAFGMTNQMIMSDLDELASRFSINLGHRPEVQDSEEEPFFYLQFDEAVRREASSMAKHYRLFYCLRSLFDLSFLRLWRRQLPAIGGIAIAFRMISDGRSVHE